MGCSTNEHRFALNDRYDKSTYLTNVVRPKAIIDFGKPSQRIPDLINKGGDVRIDLGGKSCNFISQGKEENVLMRRLNRGVTKFEKGTTRSHMFGSLYKQDDDLTPDHYDSIKIAEKAVLNKQRVKPYVDMKK
mmetsp:Transcript_23037/g.30629  ORF Transcript_23037/g.30629 Transcript_23037/m.30629 type:complete len:133 (+) Transcript_23037:1295-1693(+)